MNNRIVLSLFDNINDAMDAVHDLNNQGMGSDNASLVGLQSRMSDIQGGLANTGQPGQGSSSADMPAIGSVDINGPASNQLSSYQNSQTPLVDYLRDQGIPESDANMYAEGVRRGGILLVVNPTEGQEMQALQTMNNHDPVVLEDIVEEWRSSGWDGFNPDGDPLDENDLDWPHDITARQGEGPSEEYPEHDWPENIVDPSFVPPQQDVEPSWPHEITEPDDTRNEEEEEQESTNWPHNITKRKDEE